jgi:hypothetical protein
MHLIGNQDMFLCTRLLWVGEGRNMGSRHDKRGKTQALATYQELKRVLWCGVWQFRDVACRLFGKLIRARVPREAEVSLAPREQVRGDGWQGGQSTVNMSEDVMVDQVEGGY